MKWNDVKNSMVISKSHKSIGFGSCSSNGILLDYISDWNFLGRWGFTIREEFSGLRLIRRKV